MALLFLNGIIYLVRLGGLVMHENFGKSAASPNEAMGKLKRMKLVRQHTHLFIVLTVSTLGTQLADC